jgi:hypothetical protein
MQGGVEGERLRAGIGHVQGQRKLRPADGHLQIEHKAVDPIPGGVVSLSPSEKWAVALSFRRSGFRTCCHGRLRRSRARAARSLAGELRKAHRHAAANSAPQSRSCAEEQALDAIGRDPRDHVRAVRRDPGGGPIPALSRTGEKPECEVL